MEEAIDPPAPPPPPAPPLPSQARLSIATQQTIIRQQLFDMPIQQQVMDLPVQQQIVDLPVQQQMVDISTEPSGVPPPPPPPPPLPSTKRSKATAPLKVMIKDKAMSNDNTESEDLSNLIQNYSRDWLSKAAVVDKSDAKRVRLLNTQYILDISINLSISIIECYANVGDEQEKDGV